MDIISVPTKADWVQWDMPGEFAWRSASRTSILIDRSSIFLSNSFFSATLDFFFSFFVSRCLGTGPFSLEILAIRSWIVLTKFGELFDGGLPSFSLVDFCCITLDSLTNPIILFFFERKWIPNCIPRKAADKGWISSMPSTPHDPTVKWPPMTNSSTHAVSGAPRSSTKKKVL